MSKHNTPYLPEALFRQQQLEQQYMAKPKPRENTCKGCGGHHPLDIHGVCVSCALKDMEVSK